MDTKSVLERSAFHVSTILVSIAFGYFSPLRKEDGPRASSHALHSVVGKTQKRGVPMSTEANRRNNATLGDASQESNRDAEVSH